MTWQGGKLRREIGPVSSFARLKPMAEDRDDPAAALNALATALNGFQNDVSLHVRLVSGDDGETVEHWHVRGGLKAAKAQNKEPKKPDVTVVMRPETWLLIAQGRLAPYEALYAGKLRVGGDLEAAKALVQHLTDPAATYRSPC
jgi:putative sterol carrier protein